MGFGLVYISTVLYNFCNCVFNLKNGASLVDWFEKLIYRLIESNFTSIICFTIVAGSIFNMSFIIRFYKLLSSVFDS